jgi:DNA-binding phage protein
MPKTHSYHDYLIQSLQEIEESAAYIQAILEEEAPEPELLLTALRDIVKSQSEVSTIAEEDRQNWEKLQELLKASGGEEIYLFIGLLKTLGLQTEITVSQNSIREAAILENPSTANALATQ